jgi:hypothetical protein
MPVEGRIDPDRQLSLAPTVVSTSIPGEVVILDPIAGRYFSLEGVGPRAWELLQGSTTLAAMVETIVAEYDVDPATCERDVRGLVDDLVARGLVLVEATPDSS